MKLKEMIIERYGNCNICPHNCKVNRNNGERGFCGLNKEGIVFLHSILYNEEKEISPTYAIYFSGCNMRCSFCSFKNYLYNFSYNKATPEFFKIIEKNILKSHVKTITFIGGEPGINILSIVDFIENTNINLPYVLNTNFYFSTDILKIFFEFIDFFIPDIHFGNNECALKISKAPNYFETVSKNIVLTKNYQKPMILRHLLLPGHFECCFLPILNWVERNIPDVPFHIMTNFLEPKGVIFPEYKYEIKKALDYAEKRNINLYNKKHSSSKQADSFQFYIDKKGRIFIPLENDNLLLNEILFKINNYE